MFPVRLFILLWILPVLTQGQKDSLGLQLLYMVPVVPNAIQTDNLHNLYLIADGTITKYDSNGKKCCTYTREPGATIRLDVSNPLRPLAFYPLQGQLVVLDNTLSEVSKAINLQQKFNQRMITLAAQSVQNAFWFYDSMNFELLRTTEQLDIIAKTGNLPQLLRQNFDPVFMREFNNRLYVSNPATGIVVFDLYGTYVKTIPLPGIQRFQIFEGLLVYSRGPELIYHNLLTHAETSLDTGISDVSDICQQGNYIFVKRKDQVAVFMLQSPVAKP